MSQQHVLTPKTDQIPESSSSTAPGSSKVTIVPVPYIFTSTLCSVKSFGLCQQWTDLTISNLRYWPMDTHSRTPIYFGTLIIYFTKIVTISMGFWAGRRIKGLNHWNILYWIWLPLWTVWHQYFFSYFYCLSPPFMIYTLYPYFSASYILFFKSPSVFSIYLFSIQ